MTNRIPAPLGEIVADWSPPPVPSRETMCGRFGRLEPLDIDAHSADLFAANQLDRDNAIWDYLPYGPFADLDAYQKWLCDACLGDDPLFFAIIDGTINRACGIASYLRVNPAAGSIEVGHINYAPPLQRTPLATEAMYLMMRNIFALGYRRYEWKCNALNARSRNAALRLGFQFEGVFRQMMVVKGRNRDTAWFSVIDREWSALKRAFETWLAADNFDPSGKQRQSLGDLIGKRE